MLYKGIKSVEAEKKNKEACKSWQNLDTFAQLITLSYILKEKRKFTRGRRGPGITERLYVKRSSHQKYSMVCEYSEVPEPRARSPRGGSVSNKSGTNIVWQLAGNQQNSYLLPPPSLHIPLQDVYMEGKFITTTELGCWGKVENESAWFAHSKLGSSPSPPNPLPLKGPRQSKFRPQGPHYLHTESALRGILPQDGLKPSPNSQYS